MHPHRFDTSKRALLGIAFGILASLSIEHAALADDSRDRAPTVRITLAQVFVTHDVQQNMSRIRSAFARAKIDRSQWIFFPEGALSGYYDGFDQSEVSAAFDEVCRLCRDGQVTALIGTCWKEPEGVFNEIRIVDDRGRLAGRYAKTCLTRGDARQFKVGTFPLVHEAAGLTFGTLICNDLWVTPGFSDGPNPHLTLKQAKSGAQVIFHAVNSGSSQNYREYHEANLKVRSAEAGCPIVVVNAARDEPINCASGVVDGFEYTVQLPRKGEVIQTVEFEPSIQAVP
jgi:predicted amidohydrolase